jgi:hypothetical protein
MSDKPIEDATANSKAITPKEEKTLLFYDDTLAGARLPDGTIVVPVKWICDNLGLNGDRNITESRETTFFANLDYSYPSHSQKTTLTVEPGIKYQCFACR